MRKTTSICLIIIIVLNIIALISAIMVYNNFTKNKISENVTLEETFNEIIEIHKIKYDTTILGYNYYKNDEGHNYEIIHDYEPNNGWGSSIYTTRYIKTDTGNIYEISNEKN